MTATGSNGHYVTYTLRQDIFRNLVANAGPVNLLERVEKGYRKETPYFSSCDWRKLKNMDLEISEHQQQGKTYLQMDYSRENHNLAWFKAPVGPNGELYLALRFGYSPDSRVTRAYDVNNRHKFFCYTKENALEIAGEVSSSACSSLLPVNKVPRIYRKQHFYWGQGSIGAKGEKPIGTRNHLLAKAMENKAGAVLAASSFQYDNVGNITKETVYGDLTGKVTDVDLNISRKRHNQSWEC